MSIRGGLAALVVVLAMLVSACGGAQARLASHMERGRAYLAKRDYVKATVEFRNAIQIDPKNAQARLLAGHTAELLARWREAAGLYQSVIDAHPDNAEARADLGRLYGLAGAPAKPASPLRATHA